MDIRFGKRKIIWLISLFVTALINTPRIVLLLRNSELSVSVGISWLDILIRTLILFVFSWLVLSFNLNWKWDWLENVHKLHRRLVDIFANVALLIVGSISLTAFRPFLSPNFLERRELFVMSLIVYAIVLFILWWTSHLIHISFQYQQSLLEKERLKGESVRHQLEALRNQLNPHFLFNSLNSLHALIRTGSAKATVFVDKLSWLLRQTLQDGGKDLISLKEELALVEAYCFLQKERYGEKLSVQLEIEKEWDLQEVPAFSLQSLIENAIKHNIVSAQNPLHIEIRAENDQLVVVNSLQARRDRAPSTGQGLVNLSRRFKLLKGKEIQIERSQTHFIVKLPMD